MKSLLGAIKDILGELALIALVPGMILLAILLRPESIPEDSGRPSAPTEAEVRDRMAEIAVKERQAAEERTELIPRPFDERRHHGSRNVRDTHTFSNAWPPRHPGGLVPLARIGPEGPRIDLGVEVPIESNSRSP